MQRPIAKTSRPDRVNLSMPKLPNRSSHQARTGWSRIWRKFLLKYYLNLCKKITNKKPVVKQIGNLLLIGWLLNHSKSTKSLPEPTELYQCQNGSAKPALSVHLYKLLIDIYFLGEPEDIINQRETVGTVTRICQELPRCNWLEEKILKGSAAVSGIHSSTTSCNKDQTE